MNNANKNFLVKKEFLIILLLLLLALIIRIGIVIKIEEPIDKDALEYYSIVKNVIEKHIFSIDGVSPTARRSPGYPIFLAGIITIFGSNPRILYISQAMINILTIFLIFLSLKYINVKSSLRLFIVLLFSLSTSFIYINVLYAEILTMFVITLVLLLAVHSGIQSRPFQQSFLTGILLGLLVHLRPTFLYLPFFMIFSIIIIKIFKPRFKIRNHLVTVTVALIVVAPWTIRNYVVFRQFIPLVSAGGGELWGTNFEINDRVVWHSVSDIEKYEDQRTASHIRQNALITQYRSQYDLQNPEDLNRFLSKQGQTIILHHPFRYALLCFNRLMIFWFSPPIGSTSLKAFSPVIFVVILLFKYSLTILAIFGLFKFARQDFQGAFVWLAILLYLTLLHAVTHSIQRYFLPVIPLMYFGLGYLLNSVRNNKL